MEENKTPTEIIQDLIEEVKDKKGLIIYNNPANQNQSIECMAIIDVRWLGEEAIKRAGKELTK
jgi:hypothetical protein